MSHMKTGNGLDLANGATFATLGPILQYWSGLPLASPGDIPDPRINPGSCELQADSLPSEPLGKAVLQDKSSYMKALGIMQSFVMFKDLIRQWLHAQRAEVSTGTCVSESLAFPKTTF